MPHKLTVSLVPLGAALVVHSGTAMTLAPQKGQKAIGCGPESTYACVALSHQSTLSLSIAALNVWQQVVAGAAQLVGLTL